MNPLLKSYYCVVLTSTTVVLSEVATLTDTRVYRIRESRTSPLQEVKLIKIAGTNQLSDQELTKASI
jgi:hypothetical protein